MKKIILVATLAVASMGMAETVKLPPPDTDSGMSVVKALQARHSERAFSEKEIPVETLSGLLWAANGFNRPDKRTNATALNLQTITIYVITKFGAYRYEAKANELVQVCDKDLRPAIAAHQPYAANAPVSLLITADIGGDAYKGKRNTLTQYDAGIVSGNIYLYCAANSLVTVCRASMDRDVLKKELKLSDNIILHLNHPVGYTAEKAK